MPVVIPTSASVVVLTGAGEKAFCAGADLGTRSIEQVDHCGVRRIVDDRVSGAVRRPAGKRQILPGEEHGKRFAIRRVRMDGAGHRRDSGRSAGTRRLRRQRRGRRAGSDGPRLRPRRTEHRDRHDRHDDECCPGERDGPGPSRQGETGDGSAKAKPKARPTIRKRGNGGMRLGDHRPVHLRRAGQRALNGLLEMVAHSRTSASYPARRRLSAW